MFRLGYVVLGVSAALLASPAQARDVKITQDLEVVEVEINGSAVVIERIQDMDNRLTNDFAKTSRKCPPFCIHPMKAADGVETVGELEVIEFLRTDVANGDGLLIDARIPAWFEKGAIPGAINVPFTLFSATDNAYLDEILDALGARKSGDGWDFSEAKRLVLYCNGPWCDQSPRAIHGLIDAGYPPEKLYYYRGGMQNWQLLGLSTTTNLTN